MDDYGFLDQPLEDTPDLEALPEGTEAEVTLIGLYPGIAESSGKPYVRTRLVITGGDLHDVDPDTVPELEAVFYSMPAEGDDNRVKLGKRDRWKKFLRTFGIYEEYIDRGFTALETTSGTVVAWADTEEQVEGYSAFATLKEVRQDDGSTRNAVRTWTMSA